ncbi:hypothetical protein BH20ACT24_BH20ACT24_10210 [soil metagenome]
MMPTGSATSGATVGTVEAGVWVRSNELRAAKSAIGAGPRHFPDAGEDLPTGTHA